MCCVANVGVDVGLTTDFEGRPIPEGMPPDIGPYEFAFTTDEYLYTSDGLDAGGAVPKRDR